MSQETLLHTIEPGPEQGRQQQQAPLAFVQAQKEGASEQEVREAQRQAVLLQLGAGLLISGSREQGLQLLDAGAWKEAETLHAEAVRAIAPEQLMPEHLAAELQILRTESELLSHELSLALGHGSLVPGAVAEHGSTGPDQWQSLSRSQLGQDLWVLEQLQWKREG
jgi:hypothetical protein